MSTSSQLTLAGLSDGMGWELLSLDEDRRSNRCTAACLQARGELRAGLLAALAEGLGTRRVSQAYGVSREVVRSLRRQALNSGELDHAKQELARDALDLARLTVDRIRDEIDEMPKSSLPIIAGIMIDKAQLLSGGPTSRVAQTKEGAGVADVAAYIDALPLAQPVVEGEMVEQKAVGGSAGVAGAGGVIERGDGVVVGSGDSVSPDLRAVSEEESQ